MAEPLSPERLAEIRARHAAQVKRYAPDEPLPAAEQVLTLAEDRDRLIGQDVADLLGEVDRLRAELDHLRRKKPMPAYINGDSGGGLTLRHTDCDGHIAFVDAGDDFDQLDARRRAHVCESGGGS